MKMTREYIMAHTPRQIAAEHTAEEIQNELKYCAIDEEARYSIIGSSDPVDFADTIGRDMITDCERCLVDWYDLNNEERPEYTAEDMAEMLTLTSAWQIEEDA